jgi:outer membrane protein OmpA-like peptidoglycan-associated protein
MVRLRAALPCLCAALAACATAPKPRPSDDDGAGGGDGGAAKNEWVLEIFGDTDKDGIDDARDRCPGEAEDEDLFQDDDGCPELDNDHDRVLDADDKCPNEPETYNAVDDDDGCPDRGFVRAGPGSVFDFHILFAGGRAVIESRSLANVDALAVAIKDECRTVEVQGHASDDERRPEVLAAARAEAVRAALIARGVPREQVKVRSFGATQPLCREATESCRGGNRRAQPILLDLRICK